MMIKHTPLPWTVEPDSHASGVLLQVVGPSDIVAGLDGIVQTHRDNDRSFEERRENMRFIALACNSHYDLLIVVKEAIPFLEAIAKHHHPSWKPEMADKGSILGRAYDAIAKAEGRQ